MQTLYFKHMLIRTPFEAPARWLRELAELPKRLLHPELYDFWVEDDRMDTILRRLLKRDSNCVDVGSHIGSVLAQFVKYSSHGQHVAYEPIARKAEWLKKKFPEAQIRNCALAEEAGIVNFSEDLELSGFSSLGSGDRGSGNVQTVQVRCETLDDLLADKRRFSLLKVDVEGAELKVLRGGLKLIERDQPAIIFESSHDGAARLGLTREALFHFFTEELGYSVYTFKDFLEGGDPLDLHSFQQAAVYPYQALNFLATCATCATCGGASRYA